MHSCRHLSPRRPGPDRQTSSECFSSPVSTPALDFPPHAKRRRSGPSPPFLVRSPEMALVSFVGRVLFASVFLISAYQEFIGFGDDGGHAAKELKAKFDIVSKHIHAHLGFQMPELEMKLVVASGINIKAFGGLLFIFGNPLGANLLALYLAISTPIAFDFYSYGVDEPEFLQLFAKFVENLALFGALLFFLGMKNSAPRTASKRSPKTKTA